MSEPILERLSRFTPEAGSLDRDGLLYTAGQRSARPNRPWIALAAALAATQMLTLALWWERPAPSAAALPLNAAPAPAQTSPSEPSSPDSSDSPGLWSARRNLLDAAETEGRLPPSQTGSFVESGPPLRAFAAPSTSILN
ncbi:MAG: hypothetical protein ACJ8FY_23155 [Gemmataceae bacterium]